ncbi:pantothenate kinase [Vavraia culicis subsp. floridensis]|uniref:Pantothenate kinase n=1 Tax=Vavraia culicis (isolate floridensis) TaxID=948595 RepID=L2GRM3_VAVCU|nr:pantothenate kinase [Vavraia culicis subsp. floridensis]ELA46027.1 pantothenate kinase [Vavraia culicis subsp. floridensis]
MSFFFFATVVFSTISMIGIDFGGSLIKCVEIVGNETKFTVMKIKDVVELSNMLKQKSGAKLMLTGGGSYKHNFLPHENILPEMEALYLGYQYILEHDIQQFYTYNPISMNKNKVARTNECILVNIGSGISIIRLTQNNFARLGGTTIGGGTFAGLGWLICKEENIDKMFDMASLGNNFGVDLSINDIYGNCDTRNLLGLSNNLVASSFGKVSLSSDIEFSKYDILSSLLSLIVNNVCLMAISHAEKQNMARIVFSGCFSLQDVVQKRIVYCFHALRKTSIEPVFIEHAGHLGAFGCINWIMHNNR